MSRIWEKISDWVLFAALIIMSIVMMFASNDPLTRGLRARSLEVTSVVETWFVGLGRYVRALEENEALREQNLELSNDVARMRDAVHENTRLRSMLALSDSSSVEMIAAEIVSKDITRERNHFVLSVGRADGVEEGMAVIDTRGIIGKTDLVTENRAQVMTYLNSDFILPVVVLPAGADGMLEWNGERFDRLSMNLVSRSTRVSAGDIVVTSGYSSIFHAGYPVGVVDTVFTPPGMPTHTIFVRPAAPLDDATHVFVVRRHGVPNQIDPSPES
ncbi:MAG: rod shape-determining protein MreC [Rhodothermales bacterium]|nr:rod shape-determining protein MreC [Rhodothermales bacterium]